MTPSRKARHLARGKRSATPGIHHPPPSCVRRGRELHHPPCNFGVYMAAGFVTAPRLSSTTAKVDGCQEYAICPYSIHLRRGSPMCSTTYTTTPRLSNSNNHYHTKNLTNNPREIFSFPALRLISDAYANRVVVMPLQLCPRPGSALAADNANMRTIIG